MKKAVIIFSGGLDSTTCLAIAKAQGFACYALSFDYNQRHRVELTAAKKIAQAMNVQEHKIISVPLGQWGGSALTDLTLTIPKSKTGPEIPITYVPARNTIFLSLALGYAETLDAHDIYIGVSNVEYSNYSDCRPEFIQAFQTVANLATKAGVEGNSFNIHTPLMQLTKAETIKLGLSLGVDYSMTITCYQATVNGAACGTCHSCALRKKGFQDLGIEDPIGYLNVVNEN